MVIRRTSTSTRRVVLYRILKLQWFTQSLYAIEMMERLNKAMSYKTAFYLKNAHNNPFCLILWCESRLGFRSSKKYLAKSMSLLIKKRSSRWIKKMKLQLWETRNKMLLHKSLPKIEKPRLHRAIQLYLKILFHLSLHNLDSSLKRNKSPTHRQPDMLRSLTDRFHLIHLKLLNLI